MDNGTVRVPALLSGIGCLTFQLLQTVKRAAHAARAEAEHVGVDHCGLYVAVAEKLLDRADVVGCREQVRGEVSDWGHTFAARFCDEETKV